MTSIHNLVIELGVLEGLEITVPLRTAQEYDMVLIYLADSRYTFFIYIFQLSVELFYILEVRSDRLVVQFITQDDRLVLIMIGNLAPDVAVKLLALLAVEQPRIAVAIINIIACLSTGSIVHIQDKVKICFTTPVYERIYTGKSILIDRQTHIIFVRKQFIMERQADGIGTRILDELYIFARHIIILECLPEVGCKVRTHQLTEHLVDEASRIGFIEPEHIALRIQPVTQIRAHDEELRAIGFY